MSKTFFELYMDGNASIDDLDDFLELWHTKNSNLPIEDYLGLTKDQYFKWCDDPNLLKKELDEEKEKNSIGVLTYASLNKMAKQIVASVLNNDVKTFHVDKGEGIFFIVQKQYNSFNPPEQKIKEDAISLMNSSINDIIDSNIGDYGINWTDFEFSDYGIFENPFEHSMLPDNWVLQVNFKIDIDKINKDNFNNYGGGVKDNKLLNDRLNGISNVLTSKGYTKD